MDTDREVDFHLTLIAIIVLNVSPAAGFLFGWSLTEVILVFWIATGGTSLCYLGLLAFAQVESRVADKDGRMHMKQVSFPRSRRSVHLTDRLPPIHLHNLRFVPTNLLAVVVMWFVFWVHLFNNTRSSFILESSPDGIPLEVIIAPVTTPGVLEMGIALVIAHTAVVSREFFGMRQYEKFSAAMVAELPNRAIVFWFVVLFAGTMGTIVPRMAGNVPATQALVSALTVGGKLAVDVTLLRVGRGQSEGWFTTWFVPYEPTPESE